MDAVGTMRGVKKQLLNWLLIGIPESSKNASAIPSITAKGTATIEKNKVFPTAVRNATFWITLI